jgi:hypothetical protein
MPDFKHQTMCNKVCCRIGKAAPDTYRMLKRAIKEETISRTQTSDSFPYLKYGVTSVNGAECSGHPSSSIAVENVLYE